MVVNKSLEIDLPCGVFYDLSNLVLDINGTLTLDGEFIEGVEERLAQLSQVLDIYLLTADTNQTADIIKEKLSQYPSIQVHKLETGRGDVQKLNFLEQLGREKTAAIGNGCNDALLLKEAALGVCVIGPEGASIEAIMASKAVFLNICDALDIFLKKNRMIATLRK